MQHKRGRDSRKRSAFTLVEMLVTVAIVSILASVAGPAFEMYVRRTKTVEATTQLKVLFLGAAAYYQMPRTTEGTGATTIGHCTVKKVSRTPYWPTKEKVTTNYAAIPSFRDVGFTLADPHYYSYSIAGYHNNQCGISPETNTIYFLGARADLDGDGVKSQFKQRVGSNADNQLYHQRLEITNELE